MQLQRYILTQIQKHPFSNPQIFVDTDELLVDPEFGTDAIERQRTATHSNA